MFFFIAGCSSNPKKGGFFDGIYGMSSGKYQERVEQRETKYEKLSEANKLLSEERESLEEQKLELARKEQSHRRQIAAIESELNDMQEQLKAVSLNKQDLTDEKNNLEKQLAYLNTKVQEAKQANEQGLEIKDELIQLRQEKEQIKKQIIELSS